MFYSISVDRTHDAPLLHVPFKRKKKQSSHRRELSVGVSELLCPNHNFLLREGFCRALRSSTLHIFFFTNKQLKKSAKNYHDRHALNPCSNWTIFFSTLKNFFKDCAQVGKNLHVLFKDSLMNQWSCHTCTNYYVLFQGSLPVSYTHLRAHET